MFGDNDNQQTDQNTEGAAAPQSMPGFTPPPADPVQTPEDSNLQLPASPVLPGGNGVEPSDETAAPDNAGASAPEAPAAPEPSNFSPFDPASAVTAPGSVDDGGLTASPNDLIRLKQDALQKLSPLVDHLEQTPEERFRTTMMLIQATDDSSKIQDAYDAADQITDEKVKAQALLDVVNEINYFTHKDSADQPEFSE